MAWPYQFLDLSTPEKQERRLSLDRHAGFAQLSALVPIVVVLVVRFVVWITGRLSARKVAYDAVPGSPVAKYKRENASSSWAATGRRIAWWLGDDVVFAGQNWGRRDSLLFGGSWMVWLLFLCVQGTGKDYFHLTKRFGAIAASQFPIQYLLALKYINPVAYALRSSHEEVNRWHRVIGRIIYLLLCLHGAFYINYYIQTGVLVQRLTSSRVAIIGFAALLGMTLLTTTAFSWVRKYSYRVFFITHLLVALALPPMIFFHVHHARVYMIESLVVFIVDLGARKITTTAAVAKLELVHGTNLIKIVAQVPQKFASKFGDFPGSHVYVSIPVASRSGSLKMLYEFMFNPFTVASVNEDSRELTLVTRQLKGPMSRAFGNLANLSASGQKIPLSMEGPYGSSRYFPSLVGSHVDRVLLVAGGVGSTFVIPIYQYITTENPAARVDLIWSIREAGEATWATAGAEKSILDDDRIQLFLTGNMFDTSSDARSSHAVHEDVELEQLPQDLGRSKSQSSLHSKRPDFQKIVDDIFRQGQEEKVAVLVCGSEGMARDLRACITKWVVKGRQVWWHNENFSW
ncbi:metalloreductase AIM14 [Seiridium cupressi]